jgi:excisionase family DNA binding protein
MVEEAGAQLGLSRAGSYRAVQRGDIPTERDGRFLRVPRKRWNRIRKRIALIEKEAL